MAEKVFEHFPKLEEKVRMRMIEKMPPDDRCRLTRCSKKCDIEVRISKNYIYELCIYCRSNDNIQVSVKLSGYFRQYGYQFNFVENSGKKFKIYKTSNFQELWKVELDSSANLFQCAMEEFKRLLTMYQNIIQKLCLDKGHEFEDEEVVNINYGILNLKKLEDLFVAGHFDLVQILSKLQHPLKTLWISKVEDISNCAQIYQIEYNIYWPDGQLTNEQFLQLSAKHVDINIGKLTEKDFFRFLRSWQDGTIREGFVRCCWNLENSRIDKKKLLKLLRIADDENWSFEMKHFNVPGMSGLLTVDNYRWVFDIRFLFE